MYSYLALTGPVGNHQSNDENDVAATDLALRDIGAYVPLPEHADAPSRYITRGMTTAIEQMQEQTGLRVTGKVGPGDETERLINNRLLGKPRGAGLLRDDLGALRGTVGNWRENHEDDVVRVKRGLGAVGQLPEHPFDSPDGIIDAKTSKAIERFQTANGLTVDGWLGPGGETEATLKKTIDGLRRANLGAWQDYAQREERMRAAVYRPNDEGEPTFDLARTIPQPGPGLPLFGAPAAPNWRLPGRRPQAPTAQRWPFGSQRPRPHVNIPDDLEIWGPEGPAPGPRRDVPGLTPPRPAFTPGAVRDIERELLRREGFQTYVPEPGDPLAIPLTMYNPDGRHGSPRVQWQTAELAWTVIKECEAVLDGANIRQTTGPSFQDDKFVHLREKGVQHPAERSTPSYPDGTIEIEYRGTTIIVYLDTYSSLVDGTPNARERRQFAQLDYKLHHKNRIYVRMPKLDKDEKIDPDALGAYMRELCKKIKAAKDEGKLDDPDEKVRIEALLREFRKRQQRKSKSVEEAP
jgi:hypothetical protein